MSDYGDDDNGGYAEEESYEQEEEREESGSASGSDHEEEQEEEEERPYYDHESSSEQRAYSGGGQQYSSSGYGSQQTDEYGSRGYEGQQSEGHGGSHGGLLGGLGGGLLGGVIGAAASRFGKGSSSGGGQESHESYPSQGGYQSQGVYPSQGGYPGNYENREQSHGQSQVPHAPPQGQVQFGHGAPAEYAYSYSNCTGRRKALLVGINYIGQSGQLSGCINDVHNVSTYLVEKFGYARRDMVILTDDAQDPTGQPTRHNILRAMQWLVDGAEPNDSLFFHYSGHGGSTEDKNGDEEDGNDEVIYPIDYKEAGHILDDDMHTILVNPLKSGVRLTCIFDSCHSGSALDLPYMYSTSGVVKEPNLAKEAGEGLLNVFTSANSGDYGGAAKHVFNFFKQASSSGDARERTIATKTSPADVIMWSGSKDDQTSADATINAQATGAMSWAFIGAMKQNPQQSYVQLLNSIREVLATKYTQKPQLSSSHPIDTDLLFIM